MPSFAYQSVNIRALVTYTNASPKDLEIQVAYQRFKYGDVSSYNFPAPANPDQPNELSLSAFLANSPKETVEVQSLCSGKHEELFGVFTQLADSRLPAAYILLVPYE